MGSESYVMDHGPHGRDLRRNPRHRLLLPVGIRMGRSISKGLVLDLSANGCLLETDCSFSIGEMVEIELHENEDLLFRCKVIWRGDELLGCEFEEPIPAHIVDEARLWSVPSTIGEAIDGASRRPAGHSDRFRPEECRPDRRGTGAKDRRQQADALVVGDGSQSPVGGEPGKSQTGAEPSGRKRRTSRSRR